MTFQERREEAAGFAARLWLALEHDRGASVELRRLLAPAPIPTRAYWQLEPPRWVWPRELSMWLAGLAASRPRSMAPPRPVPQRAGETIRHARDQIAVEGRGSATAFERQVSALLTCHADDLRRDLVPVVELAQRVGAKFDYGALLLDLSRWDDQARRAQREWAEDLWAPRRLATDQPSGEETAA